MLSDLEDEALAVVLDLEGRQDGREGLIELDVDDGTDDRADLAKVLLAGDGSGLGTSCERRGRGRRGRRRKEKGT